MARDTNSTSTEFYRKKNKEEMKYQLITFAAMIIFTLVSFGLVIGEYHPMFTIPVIILLACVQVGFQLYYFMHMNHKGHALPALFLYSGVFVAILTILAMVTIVWW
ncbi:cytochrome c oxidase subunit IVB [Pontibacillus yanchengensis]|uniref:Cytochrome c oxidase subunit IVB n=2 Tax=Pontibacillus yanchengensis TaxID=462910 RepID=A0ACC7VBN5_9BACI|nr:cytochrome c oxidase subunit IVB [Pontibacillus yanchengensis]MYL33007.1 cytochrome c oxidase subunit IVB [Pontibacillus yanchengensis]MYL52143.1 cytochrome c oxidase subunit IVB [Pontibacillus yanchengensis]